MTNNKPIGRPRADLKNYLWIRADYFKPQGVSVKEQGIIELTIDEVEALRLKNIKDFSQSEAAEQMNTSQSTFQRILASAYKKVSLAIVEGKGIKIKR